MSLVQISDFQLRQFWSGGLSLEPQVPSAIYQNKTKNISPDLFVEYLSDLPQQGPLWVLKLQLLQLELLLRSPAVVSAAVVVTEGQQLPFP